MPPWQQLWGNYVRPCDERRLGITSKVHHAIDAPYACIHLMEINATALFSENNIDDYSTEILITVQMI